MRARSISDLRLMSNTVIMKNGIFRSDRPSNGTATGGRVYRMFARVTSESCGDTASIAPLYWPKVDLTVVRAMDAFAKREFLVARRSPGSETRAPFVSTPKA